MNIWNSCIQQRRRMAQDIPHIDLPINKLTKNAVTLCSLIDSNLGFSPGACVVLNTVKAPRCVTDLTVAAHTHGKPNAPLNAASRPRMKRSRWKPPPFCNLLSFLFTIEYIEMDIHVHGWRLMFQACLLQPQPLTQIMVTIRLYIRDVLER